ncbi:hypothetical protein ACG3SL_05350 [Sphingomonas sp. CJ20]
MIASRPANVPTSSRPLDINGQCEIALEVTEAVLNHLSGSRAGIVGVYQRHNYLDEKGVALKAWAKEVSRLTRAAKKAANSRKGA